MKTKQPLKQQVLEDRPIVDQAKRAAQNGEYCFHPEHDGQYCGRPREWSGHRTQHNYQEE